MQSQAMNNLAYYRDLKGLSQQQLGEMIGRGQSTIQRAEASAPSAKLITFIKCAEVLGIKLSQIFDDRSVIESELVKIFLDSDQKERDRISRIVLAVLHESETPSE